MGRIDYDDDNDDGGLRCLCARRTPYLYIYTHILYYTRISLFKILDEIAAGRLGRAHYKYNIIYNIAAQIRI